MSWQYRTGSNRLVSWWVVNGISGAEHSLCKAEENLFYGVCLLVSIDERNNPEAILESGNDLRGDPRSRTTVRDELIPKIMLDTE